MTGRAISQNTNKLQDDLKVTMKITIEYAVLQTLSLEHTQLQIFSILSFIFQQIVFNKWKFSRGMKQGNDNKSSMNTKTKQHYKTDGRTDGRKDCVLLVLFYDSTVIQFISPFPHIYCCDVFHAIDKLIDTKTRDKHYNSQCCTSQLYIA